MLLMDENRFVVPDHWINNDIRIALVGVGATGSALATLLFKLHHIRQSISDGLVGLKVSLFDPKSVTVTGVNRTGFLRHEVGFNKAVVMANKLNISYGIPFCKGVAAPFTPDQCRHYDVIITATDSAASRLAIAQAYVSKVTTLWLDVGVGGAAGNVVLGQLGKGKHRLPNVADLFDLTTAEKEDKTLQRASCDTLDAITRQAFCVNEVGAATAMGLLSRLIVRGQLSTHGCMYDIEQGDSVPINIDKQVWRGFGYNYRKNPDKMAA